MSTLDLLEEKSPPSAPACSGGEKGGNRDRDPLSGTVKIPIGLTGSESGNGEGRGRVLGGDYDEIMAESPSQEPEEEEEQENRLLEAGGVLGRRIQQTLGEVLEYDCSVGVATNRASTLRNTGMKQRKPFREGRGGEGRS